MRIFIWNIWGVFQAHETMRGEESSHKEKKDKPSLRRTQELEMQLPFY